MLKGPSHHVPPISPGVNSDCHNSALGLPLSVRDADPRRSIHCPQHAVRPLAVKGTLSEMVSLE
jgi:hypothetical protein